MGMTRNLMADILSITGTKPQATDSRVVDGVKHTLTIKANVESLTDDAYIEASANKGNKWTAKDETEGSEKRQSKEHTGLGARQVAQVFYGRYSELEKENHAIEALRAEEQARQEAHASAIKARNDAELAKAELLREQIEEKRLLAEAETARAEQEAQEAREELERIARERKERKSKKQGTNRLNHVANGEPLPS